MDLPNCPTCHGLVHRAESTGGYVSFQCVNEKCDHYPATAFLEETEARKQWLLIVEANQPKSASSTDH
jgi:hypothetical protein